MLLATWITHGASVCALLYKHGKAEFFLTFCAFLFQKFAGGQSLAAKTPLFSTSNAILTPRENVFNMAVE
tara:strand:+ start:92 stop:301 length:210 start_codon:yes stop_codon:yes gene_type:complete